MHFPCGFWQIELGIKTASLYNHVENMETLLSEVCRYGMCLQKEAEMQAIEGWHGEEAVRFLAETYRSFAKEHRELYWLIMNMAAKDSRVLDDAAVLFTDPIKKVLEDFNLKEEESIHYRRLFRAIVHGFVSQEEQGFFSHYPAEVDGSFHFAGAVLHRQPETGRKEVLLIWEKAKIMRNCFAVCRWHRQF